MPICAPCQRRQHDGCTDCPCAHQAPQTPPSPEDGSTTPITTRQDTT